MATEEKNVPNQINIELKEDVAQGTYSNLAIITHSSSEFVIDFVRIMPGLPKADVKSRIILSCLTPRCSWRSRPRWRIGFCR